MKAFLFPITSVRKFSIVNEWKKVPASLLSSHGHSVFPLSLLLSCPYKAVLSIYMKNLALRQPFRDHRLQEIDTFTARTVCRSPSNHLYLLIKTDLSEQLLPVMIDNLEILPSM